jgi:hypothetical protein
MSLPSFLPPLHSLPLLHNGRRPPKKVVVAVVAVQAVSAAFAFRDLARRGEEQVRGPKLLWRIVIGVNPGNSLAYWILGRR